MDWSDVAFALAVARSGSMTSAARALGVAHTTVYRRVNAFEERCGVRFFDRAHTPYTLTRAGKELLEVGMEIEQRLGNFERSLRGLDDQLAGEIKLTTVEALGLELARHVRSFQQQHPGIQVRLRVTNSRVEVGSECDIALRAMRDPGDTLIGRKVADIAYAVYGSLTHFGNVPPDALSECDWVCLEEEPPYVSPQGRWEARHIPPERVMLRTNARLVFLEAVTHGVGIGVLPCGLGETVPGLVALSERLDSITMPLWLLTHADLTSMPRVRVLLDFLHRELGAQRALLENAHSQS